MTLQPRQIKTFLIFFFEIFIPQNETSFRKDYGFFTNFFTANDIKTFTFQPRLTHQQRLLPRRDHLRLRRIDPARIRRGPVAIPFAAKFTPGPERVLNRRRVRRDDRNKQFMTQHFIYCIYISRANIFFKRVNNRRTHDRWNRGPRRPRRARAGFR